MDIKQVINPKLAKKQRKKRIRKIITILVVILVLAAVLILYIGRKQTNSTVYKSYTAARSTITNAISLTGNLEAVDNETITASSAATVREVYVKEGQQVHEDDRLLMLSNGQKVTASFDGTVNQLYVKKDDKVNAGESLVQIVDFNHMKVNVKVDEYDINDVRVGMECRLVATATGFKSNSTISSINYVSSSAGNVAYYTAAAYLDSDGSVYPGMQVSMTIPKSEAVDVVVLKMDALQFDSTNKAYVLMKNEAGEYVETLVETGVSNGNYVEIKSGVNEGDTVYAPDLLANDPMARIAAMMGNMDDENGDKGDRSGREPRNGMDGNGGGNMPAPGPGGN